MKTNSCHTSTHKINKVNKTTYGQCTVSTANIHNHVSSFICNHFITSLAHAVEQFPDNVLLILWFHTLQDSLQVLQSSFSLLWADVFKLTLLYIGLYGEKLNHLRFADDIVIFSENPDNLEYVYLGQLVRIDHNQYMMSLEEE